ncbi:phage portal protein [Paenibacillus sp. HJGM_3]|uniref:portal protein n=1 Tax=Paenibacillus sp. HJGM_3 TaxID=3379816 RepID=UPI00385C8E4D
MQAVTGEAQEVQKKYEAGLNYKRRMRFLDKWPEYERFKAGDQWPTATEKTKALPRPVFNIIELIEAHKVSTVMAEQVKMVFSTDDPNNEDASDLFTRYAETTWERLKQDDMNEEMLDDGSNRGTGLVHYYWDAEKNEMCGELIDPMNFFPGNPQCRHVQKQPYNIVSSREELKSVKEYAGRNGVSGPMIAMIKPDKDTKDEGYDGAQTELQDAEKVTVLTYYWKKGKTIWFKKVCSGIVIKKDTDTMMKLYPIAAMQWKRRKRSFFGVGDTEGLIPNQKSINFLMAMQVLSVQLTGWPKLVYKAQAIDPALVLNVPGEMIKDNSPPGQKGVEYLTPGSTTGQAQALVDSFIDYTRQMTGANDAATGEAPSADMNASAIMMLQQAAGVPIESIKRRFYQFIEDIGRIWEEFWKVKYNVTRRIMVKDDDGNTQPANFNGSLYKDIDMNLKIDVGPSSKYSESLMMASLDKMLEAQFITFDQYLKYAPKNVVPFKERLLKDLEAQAAQQVPPVDPMQEAEMQAQMQEKQEAQKFQQTAALKEMDNNTKVQIAQINAQAKRGVGT